MLTFLVSFSRWMEAFQAASSIEVQQVTTMDEIRINDSDLKRKWRSLEKGLQDHNKPHEEIIGGSNGKASPTGSEEDDTVSKGKRRLTWGKIGGSHSRSKSGSEKELRREAAHRWVWSLMPSVCPFIVMFVHQKI